VIQILPQLVVLGVLVVVVVTCIMAKEEARPLAAFLVVLWADVTTLTRVASEVEVGLTMVVVVAVVMTVGIAPLVALIMTAMADPVLALTCLQTRTMVMDWCV
jgi:hypothetical protein